MRVLGRALGSLSRRLERPELLAAFDRNARQVQHEELAIRAILAAALRDSAAYVDIGTNRGQVLGVAAEVAPAASLVAFEPIPALAAALRVRFPQVDCRELALGDEPGRTEFCHFHKLDGWSGLRRSPEVSDEAGDPEMIEVTVSTLDRELPEAAPAILKIDVEGAELGVLRGARETLARAHPLILLEHVPSAAALYGARSEEIWDLLSELGYELLALTHGSPLSRDAFAAAEGDVNWLARPAR